jgi:hypothetical protein
MWRANFVKPNSTRNKYNILSFSFVCFHECHEGKWGKCPHCISRTKCVDNVRPVYPSEQGIYYPIERIEVAPKCAEDLGLYVHEFTEAAIIQIMLKFRKDWHRFVEFKGYKSTYVTHFISEYGANNQTCLEPATRSHKPKW